MKNLRNLFIFSTFLYFFVQISRLYNLDIPVVINSYLTDFLCLPIILFLCLLGVRMLKRLPNYWLNLYQVVGMTSFYALLFEWYLPKQSNSYTADVFDVLAYFAGAILFFILQFIDKHKQVKVNQYTIV